MRGMRPRELHVGEEPSEVHSVQQRIFHCREYLVDVPTVVPPPGSAYSPNYSPSLHPPSPSVYAPGSEFAPTSPLMLSASVNSSRTGLVYRQFLYSVFFFFWGCFETFWP